MFSPLGEPIGAEFIVNAGFTGQEEEFPDVAALPGGGFITVYEEEAATTQSIRMTIRDAAGLNPVNLTVANDTTANAAPDYFGPRIVVGSATSALVVYGMTEAGGETEIRGRIFNPTTQAFGAEISLIASPGVNNDPAVAVLETGNYVIVCANNPVSGALTDFFVTMRIVSASGANVLAVTQVPGTLVAGRFDFDPEVTALSGGGFVVT